MPNNGKPYKYESATKVTDGKRKGYRRSGKFMKVSRRENAPKPEKNSVKET